ncbi:hypothetical protein SAMN05518849_12110 [Sphingobium sp. AP50]|nr:hypothetical protein SAMN05518849_12110 [Sphingobium sp. AP50]
MWDVQSEVHAINDRPVLAPVELERLAKRKQYEVCTASNLETEK